MAVFLIAWSDLSWRGSLILCAAVVLILCAMAALSFGALITVRADGDRLANSFFGIRVGAVGAKEIRYVRMQTSIASDWDIFAPYIVLSEQPIPYRKNIAMRFAPKTQFVIRVTKKNLPQVAALMQGSVGLWTKKLNITYDDLQTVIRRTPEGVSVCMREDGVWEDTEDVPEGDGNA
ncbi:MAG: hypothetical protein MJ192_05785 [Clostridia bacterium]|nr:hypothetical protein [Clostridia bacterium]